MNSNKKKQLRDIGFQEEIDALEKDLFPFCKSPINIQDFKDSLSLREYKISGLCQKCQDSFFE